jgi:dTDP-4-amino-4,6-dideoxygalactose transaminase
MPFPFVDLNTIHKPILGEINDAIALVIKSNDFVKSNVVESFEKNFANYIGVNCAVGCANGTDALELALEVLTLGKEDEVIVPIHSWVSTASAVSRVGAKVVFADTLYDEYTIDPESIIEKITPNTKAIIVVHLYGNPCRMNEIISIAKNNNLVIIEDCAQAHGAQYKGQKVGSFGLMSCFSFYPSKNLGALGDGGAVLTNNFSIAEKIRTIAHCGQSKKNNIRYIGRNSRLDALQAAVLNVKLKYLDQWNESRRSSAQYYNELLKDTELALPIEELDVKHVYHLYVVKTNHRDAFIKKLEENGTGYGIHYPFLLNELEGIKDGKTHENASKYKDTIISLPMYSNMNLSLLKQNILALF